MINVQISLSNNEVLRITIDSEDKEQSKVYEDKNIVTSWLTGNNNDEKVFASLEGVAKAIRVHESAKQNLKAQQNITLKYLEKGVTPFRAVGTVTFLETGLFVPVNTSKRLILDGILKMDPQLICTQLLAQKILCIQKLI